MVEDFRRNARHPVIFIIPYPCRATTAGNPTENEKKKKTRPRADEWKKKKGQTEKEIPSLTWRAGGGEGEKKSPRKKNEAIHTRGASAASVCKKGPVVGGRARFPRRPVAGKRRSVRRRFPRLITAERRLIEERINRATDGHSLLTVHGRPTLAHARLFSSFFRTLYK